MSTPYTVATSRVPAAEPSAVRAQLESGTDEERISGMEQVLFAAVGGTATPQLLVDVIRFVLPSKNKDVKKLLQQFWEAVPKLDEHGKLRQEMILVVNALRNDLQHPNEFIRGTTLRFLTKVREPELLEPLVPTVRECLAHRNAYVRKNAYFCVLAIYEHKATQFLIPDAADLVAQALTDESDGTCLRNGFVALVRIKPDAARAVFRERYSAAKDVLLRVQFLQFAAEDARRRPEQLAFYVDYLLAYTAPHADPLLMLEAANALTRVAADPTVLARAGAAFVRVASKVADAPVKIAALTRVQALVAASSSADAFADLVMDTLAVLQTQDQRVREAALGLALSLVCARTVEPVLKLLRKELEVSFKQVYDGVDAYRGALVAAIRDVATQFRESAADVAELLLEFLAELDVDASLSVLAYVKEVAESAPATRAGIVRALAQQLPAIRGARAYLSALWLLGEYTDAALVPEAWAALRESLGRIPLDAPDEEEHAAVQQSTKPKVLADGTYATESPLEAAAQAERGAARDDTHQLRRLLTQGDGFLASALAATLTKLVLRRVDAAHDAEANRLQAEALLIMASTLRAAEDIDADSVERVYGCIELLVAGSPEARLAFLEAPHAAFAELVAHNSAVAAGKSALSAETNSTRAEAPVRFRLLAPLSRGVPEFAVDEPVVARAQSQLKQVTQLTGYSDPVYAEALLTVSQFDIVLSVMLFNQTETTLEDLGVEFYTTGELKVVETPAKANVAPYSFHTVRTTIRVSSADSASIFGNIAYHTKQRESLVVLHDIRLNILDYIKPSECSDVRFREMWNAFEWENKVSVRSKAPVALAEYLELFKRETHMACLTPGAAADGAKFLSANMYARSCFGEDALANLSIEQAADGHVAGHVRIRTAQRGPAVSLGDRILQL